MAYVDDFLTQSSTTGAAAYALTLPPHVADDIIVVCVSADGGGTLTATWGGNSTGAAQVGATQVSTTVLCAAVFYAKATGTAATCQINMGTADAIHVHMLVLKDVDTTTFFDIGNAAVAATASEVTTASVTTTTADCLVLHYLAMNQNTAGTPTMAHSRPGPTATMHFLDSSDNGGTTVTTQAAGAIGWYIQRTAAATPTPQWDLSITEIHAKFVMAFRNKSGGRIPAYVDDSANLGEQLMSGTWWASATTRNNQNFKATPLTYANIGPNGAGQATSFDAGAVATDAGLNPYSSAINSTPTTTTTNAAGFELGFPTTAKDMTTGWIVGAFKTSTSKMANFNQGSIRQGGGYLTIGQGATNYRSYRIMARDNLDGNGTDFSIFSVQANQTQSRYGYSASAPTITAIDKILIGNKGHNATGAFYYMDFHLIKEVILAGGDSNFPVDTRGMFDIGRFCRLPLFKKIGTSELTAYVPIQVGGGDAINFQVDAAALQFPRISDTNEQELNYHGADNAIGISYAGKTGDVIKHTNSVITSPSPYFWEINSAATSAATWDFQGLVIVRASVTLRNVMTFTLMAFSSCPTIDASGCTLTYSSIKKVGAGNDTLTTNASTNIDNCTIDVSLVTSGNRWCSVADPTIFSSCAFTGGGGHAIRISSAAGSPFTLSGNTFTSFGVDGSNGAAIYNDSGAAIVINITGGVAAPTVRNGAGASTTINVNSTITLTGLVNGSEVRVYDSGTNAVIAGIDSVVGNQFAFSDAVANTVFIRIFNISYLPADIIDYIIPSTDAEVPVSQVFDRNYNT